MASDERDDANRVTAEPGWLTRRQSSADAVYEQPKGLIATRHEYLKSIQLINLMKERHDNLTDARKRRWSADSAGKARPVA